jgi:TolB-like protein/Tfp pilus assembly protein PilF
MASTRLAHDGAPTEAQVREALEKLCASRVFVRSGRLARFLHFAVEHALAGTGDQVKEYLVGVEVFDRKSDYDPRMDPIVRVEARRLRAKLKLYYASAGKNDAVAIEFPKGTYTPVFRTRSATVRSAPRRDAQGSVAVLPFSNLSPESGDDYFSDGLTEELIHLLTRVEGLQVVAWHSAAQLRGRDRDLRAIRDKLKVDTILTGAVRRSETRVRVTAQAVDTSNGSVLWSERYDRALSDVFDIQEEIARAIVDTLRPALRVPQKLDAARSAPNIECYNLCLEARFHANRRTPEGLHKSTACYLAAIRKDEHSALAHAGLADAYSLLCDYGLMSSEEAMPKAGAAAHRALELDPNSAEALCALAFIRSIGWRWDEADSLYRRAIAARPGYAQAHHWYSVDFLPLFGRYQEALAGIQTARMLDPLSMIVHEGYPYVLMLQRDYDGAIAALRQMMDMAPDFYKAYSTMGRVLSLAGRYDEAIAMFDKAREMAGDSPSLIAAAGQTRALAGDHAAARRAIETLLALEPNAHVPLASFAILHLGLGEISKSLDFLEAGADRHEIPVVSIGVHPLYDPLRGEPRFEALLRRMGLLTVMSLVS